jgi:hypothetical protein
MSFANLVGSDGTSIQICIVQYNLGFSSEIQTSQLRNGVVHYPIKVVQNDFTFVVQYRSDDEYQNAQKFITNAARNALTPGKANGGAIRLYWPDFNLDYSGYIKSQKMGAEKFDFAPKQTYVMQCLRDSIYSPTLTYSTAPNFNAIYGTSLVDVSSAVTVDPAPVAPGINNAPGQAPVGPDDSNHVGGQAPAAPTAAQPAAPTPGNPFQPFGISVGPFGSVKLP